MVVGVSGTWDASDKNMIGIGYGLLAAAFYASVIIMNKFLKGLSGIELSFIQLSTASLVLLPYVIVTQGVSLGGVNNQSILLVIFVGVVHTGIAYLLYFTGMQKLSGQTIALYSYIDPVSAIIMSSVILGEKMGVMQLIGGCLILGATYLGGRK